MVDSVPARAASAAKADLVSPLHKHQRLSPYGKGRGSQAVSEETINPEVASPRTLFVTKGATAASTKAATIDS